MISGKFPSLSCGQISLVIDYAIRFLPCLVEYRTQHSVLVISFFHPIPILRVHNTLHNILVEITSTR